MQDPADSPTTISPINRRVLTSALLLVSLFCLLTTLLLAGGAYVFLRPGGLLDQSGLEDDMREQAVPPASLSGKAWQVGRWSGSERGQVHGHAWCESDRMSLPA